MEKINITVEAVVISPRLRVECSLVHEMPDNWQEYITADNEVYMTSDDKEFMVKIKDE